MTEKYDWITRAYAHGLKSEIEYREKVIGKKIKPQIAKALGIAETQLTEIANNRRPGKEPLKRRIAETLFFDYQELINHGQYQLVGGLSIEKSREKIFEARQLKFKAGDSIRRIASIWGTLSDEEKAAFVEAGFKCVTQMRDSLPPTTEDKAKRFKSVWEEPFRELGLDPIYDEQALDLSMKYMSGELSDIQALEVATGLAQRASFEKQLSQLKLHDRHDAFDEADEDIEK